MIIISSSMIMHIIINYGRAGEPEAAPRGTPEDSEGGMIRSDTLVELKFVI